MVCQLENTSYCTISEVKQLSTALNLEQIGGFPSVEDVEPVTVNNDRTLLPSEFWGHQTNNEIESPCSSFHSVS